jgi:hypothetical protein
MPSVPVPNPGSVPNQALSKLPAGVPAELQQLLPKDGGRPHSRGLIQRNPMGSSGATKGAYRGAPSKN